MASVSCPDCGQLYHDRYSMLRHHRAKHFQQGFHCDVCQKIFHDRSSLQRHQKTIHPSSLRLPWNCTQCKQTFYTKKELYRHKKETHSIETTIKTTKAEHACPQCGKTFPRPSKLIRHQNGVHRLVLGFVVPETTERTQQEETDRQPTESPTPSSPLERVHTQVINNFIVETRSLN